MSHCDFKQEVLLLMRKLNDDQKLIAVCTADGRFAKLQLITY